MQNVDAPSSNPENIDVSKYAPKYVVSDPEEKDENIDDKISPKLPPNSLVVIPEETADITPEVTDQASFAMSSAAPAIEPAIALLAPKKTAASAPAVVGFFVLPKYDNNPNKPPAIPEPITTAVDMATSPELSTELTGLLRQYVNILLPNSPCPVETNPSAEINRPISGS